MGTRTDILKIAGQLRELAIRNPSVGLMPIVTELEAAAERADKKRMTKKKLVEDLLLHALPPPVLEAVPQGQLPERGGRLPDNRSWAQASACGVRKVGRGADPPGQHSGQSFAGAVGVFRTRWDA